MRDEHVTEIAPSDLLSLRSGWSRAQLTNGAVWTRRGRPPRGHGRRRAHGRRRQPERRHDQEAREGEERCRD
jgi:hypothetical protein